MASISSSSLSFLSSINVSSTYSFPPFSHRPSRTTKPKRNHFSKLTCKAIHGHPENSRTTSQEEQEASHILANRRNVVLGLGGLCGAAANPLAFANPVGPPYPAKCRPVHPEGVATNCCPPLSTNIIDFKLPSYNPPLRTRPAAHLVSDRYLAKYERATELMKALPHDDPRNFIQQANVHCAYCQGAYPLEVEGSPELDFQVHYCWLFFPFHRWYLYFYEKILGSLIDDPTFALPFWNWDSLDGMEIPAIYTDSKSPLYDAFRDPKHQPPTIIDLDFDFHRNGCRNGSVRENLATMYRQMVSNAKTPSLFFGEPHPNEDHHKQSSGSIELTPHNNVHNWTGDNRQPTREDMGIFYSAARDPIFYAHHSNVDRMWNIWNTLGGKDIKDQDWLDSAFLFYNENKQLVRVKVRDCLDTKRLGYDYEPVDIPWKDYKPTRRRPLRVRGAETFREIEFPKVLEEKVITDVLRPKKKQKEEEEEGSEMLEEEPTGTSEQKPKEEEEVLVIDVIEFDRNEAVKFDVYVTDDDDVKFIRPYNTEYAGSFVTVPHSSHKDKNKKIITRLRLGLSDLLKDLEAKGPRVPVTLVRRYGKPVKIGDIRIEYIAD